MTLDAIKIGDRIKFRAITRWSGAAVWRIVTGIQPVTVRYGGWGQFVVRPDEIIAVRSAAP